MSQVVAGRTTWAMIMGRTEGVSYFKGRVQKPPYGRRISMAEQIPFGTNDFAENPEPRVPCVLVLDTSGSMQGTPIDELNGGLSTYKSELMADNTASKRVEVAILT